MKEYLISLAISFTAGALYALCYPTYFGGGWLPLLFIALPLHFYAMSRIENFKNYLLTVTAYNLGLNITGYYWITATLQEFGNLPFSIAFITSIFFTLILQPHWWAYTFWLKYRPQWNWNSSFSLFLTAVILTILERIITQQFPSFAGSPWLHLAPYLGLAPYFGVVIFSFITYWVSLEIVEQIRIRKIRYIPWMALFVFITINAVMPLSSPQGSDTLRARVVQANIGNFLKVSSEIGDQSSLSIIIENYAQLSTKNEDFTPDLIIWPETAYPNDFNYRQNSLPKLFNDIMETTKAEMFIGGYTRNPDMDSYEYVYNSGLLFSENRVKASYFKNQLIPFGETLPFGKLNEQIIKYIPAVSLFAKGNGGEKLETKNGFRFIAPICYEILESELIRKLLNEHKSNRFIINLTNDSWYGNTAEPFQHLFLSKWRALEFGLPIIRSTNTGITSVIYPDGSESRRLNIGEQNILEEVIPLPPGKQTVYQEWGLLPFFILIALMGATLWWQEKN